MICIKVQQKQCTGAGCPQGKSHERNAFCGVGFCRGSNEMTHCVTETSEERKAWVVHVLRDDLPGDVARSRAEEIDAIYTGKEVVEL